MRASTPRSRTGVLDDVVHRYGLGKDGLITMYVENMQETQATKQPLDSTHTHPKSTIYAGRSGCCWCSINEWYNSPLHLHVRFCNQISDKDSAPPVPNLRAYYFVCKYCQHDGVRDLPAGPGSNEGSAPNACGPVFSP